MNSLVQVLAVGAFFSVISGLTGIGIGWHLCWDKAWNEGFYIAKAMFNEKPSDKIVSGPRYAVVKLGDSYFVGDRVTGRIVTGPGGVGNSNKIAQQNIADQLNS